MFEFSTYWINPYWKVVYEPREEQMALLVYQKFQERPLEVVMDIQDQNGYVYECGRGVMAVAIFETLKKLTEKENLFFLRLWESMEMQQVCQMKFYSTLKSQMKQR